jgi:small-conductance mechanosensitive channel
MVEVLGIHLIGLSWGNLHRVLLTAGFVAAAMLLRQSVLWLLHAATREEPNARLHFWTRQGVSLVTSLVILLATVSIWFDNPARLALPAGLVTAGIAFALQKVITALAGYILVMRGKTYRVGDRIVLGGVRGDVIGLGFVQTTILEMGEPEPARGESPPVWVQARQYTGRVVTVTNDKVFDTPVYNYSRVFPFIWEELRVPIPYRCDRVRAEQILLAAAREETREIKSMTAEEWAKLKREYFIELERDDPQVYLRITDNWLELTVRFVCEPHHVRALKDRMCRRILAAFDEARIDVASSTYDVVGLPPLRLVGDGAR